MHHVCLLYVSMTRNLTLTSLKMFPSSKSQQRKSTFEESQNKKKLKMKVTCVWYLCGLVFAEKQQLGHNPRKRKNARDTTKNPKTTILTCLQVLYIWQYSRSREVLICLWFFNRSGTLASTLATVHLQGTKTRKAATCSESNTGCPSSHTVWELTFWLIHWNISSTKRMLGFCLADPKRKRKKSPKNEKKKQQKTKFLHPQRILLQPKPAFWVKPNRDPTNAIVVEKTNKSWEIKVIWNSTFPFLNKNQSSEMLIVLWDVLSVFWFPSSETLNCMIITDRKDHCKL